MTDQTATQATFLDATDDMDPRGYDAGGSPRVSTSIDVFEALPWRRSAICRDIDPEVFFPVGFTGEAIQKINYAKSFCQVCPVRLDCLQYALRSNQEYGVWGGYDEQERRNLRRRLRRLHATSTLPTETTGPYDLVDGAALLCEMTQSEVTVE